MKKLLFIIIALMLFDTSMKAQWNQYLTGQTSIIDEISVVNDNVIWMTDENSTVFSISTDGGVSWQTKNFPTEFTSSNESSGGNGNISGVNATTAFTVVGMGTNKGIFKTTDSGNTWTRQSTIFNTANSFPDLVYFWNENEGVAIGDGGTNPGFEIYTTYDGGNNWNPVSYDKQPALSNAYTYNMNSSFKVLGNTFYLATNNGQIMKSTDKGVTWSLMNTPLTSISYMSFDFKDANNGLLSDYNSTTLTALLYSTTNGGATWSQIKSSTSENYSNLRYIPSQNVYTNVCQDHYSSYRGVGLSYSTDNGLTWVKNTSFQNIILGQISYTPSGKLFLGGNKYIYNSTNISAINQSVINARITGMNSIDITYSANPDPVSSQLLANYPVSYMKNKVPVSLIVQSITLDATNKSIVHILTQSNLPTDTIIINPGNIKDGNGLPVLLKELVLYNTGYGIQGISAGDLQSMLTTDQLANITYLSLTGTIDARDFKIIRDNMPALTNLDLSGSIVARYTGIGGTYSTTSTDYPANTLPSNAFYNPTTLQGKTVINKINLPSSITSIGVASFEHCTGLYSIAIPSSVTSIGDHAFYYCQHLTSIAFPSSVTSIGDFAFGNCIGLASIYAYPITPVNLSSSLNVFDGVNTVTCTLFTPANSRSVYMNATVWKNFNSIIALTNTSVQTETVDAVNFYPNPVKDGIQINGLEGAGVLTILDLNGRILLTKQITGNEYISVSTFTEGIYILKLKTSMGMIERKMIKQ